MTANGTRQEVTLAQFPRGSAGRTRLHLAVELGYEWDLASPWGPLHSLQRGPSTEFWAAPAPLLPPACPSSAFLGQTAPPPLPSIKRLFLQLRLQEER